MKAIYKYITVAALILPAAITTSSCSDFLDEDPRNALTEDKIFSDPEYAETNLQSCYDNWRGTFRGQNLTDLLKSSDEIQAGALKALKEDGGLRGCFDRCDSRLTSDLEDVKNQWEPRWTVIGDAAKLIKALKPLKDTDKTAQKAYAEASFIRGGVNMELAMIFGRIPILDLERITQLTYARQPLKDVWQFIIDDLKEAEKYLPTQNDPGRATTYAASMLLGYAYMAAPEETGLRNFKLAKEALDRVIAGPFELVDYYDLFDYSTPNTSESIFEWQCSNIWPGPNCVQFMVGSRAVQAMGSDACFMSGYDHVVPSAWAYSNIEDGGIWEDGDIRKDESIRYDFEYYGKRPTLDPLSWEGLGEDHDELLPHIKKYEDFRTDIHSGMGYNNMFNSGKNIPWLRLANAILLHAECLNELGETGLAIEEVNKVRNRAWEWSLPGEKAWKGMSKDEFREALMTERVRELFGERWRRFDIRRTGKFIEYMKARNKWCNRAPGTISAYHIYWPIPQTEIDRNDDISPEDQNEGYK